MAWGCVDAADLAGDFHQIAQHHFHIHRRGIGAGKLGIQPRGVGDVGDQPVQTPHILLQQIGQLLALGRGLDQRQGLQRRADRGQGVLDLMRDVGGEGLDGVHARRQGFGHRFQ